MATRPLPTSRRTSIPRKAVPANAITSPEDISGKVALYVLFVAQRRGAERHVRRSVRSQRPAVVRRAPDPDQQRGPGGHRHPGRPGAGRGRTHPARRLRQHDDPQRVGGAGRRAAQGVAVEDILFGEQARYLYQKVEVLAVGQNTVPQAGAAATATDDGSGTGARLRPAPPRTPASSRSWCPPGPPPVRRLRSTRATST